MTEQRATVPAAPVFRESMDDHDLAERLALDLDAAFETLVVTHQDRLYTIALRLLGDARDAEEVTQDALVRAYRAIASYDADRVRALRLRAWLAAIVVNLARNRGTRRRQAPSVRLDGLGDDRESGPAATLASVDQLGDPELATLRRASAAVWATRLGRLPDRYRAPVVLRHVDGLGFAEIAEVLGRPEGTIKAQVHRGLAMLRSAALADREAERAASTPADLIAAGALRREISA